MDLQELTQAMQAFVQSRGWCDENSPRPQTPRNLAISLSLEASEILEHFQWSGEPVDLQSVENELADVALYLLQLASVCDIDLKNAILEKLTSNYQRTWRAPENLPEVIDK